MFENLTQRYSKKKKNCAVQTETLRGPPLLYTARI